MELSFSISWPSHWANLSPSLFLSSSVQLIRPSPTTFHRRLRKVQYCPKSRLHLYGGSQLLEPKSGGKGVTSQLAFGLIEGSGLNTVGIPRWWGRTSAVGRQRGRCGGAAPAQGRPLAADRQELQRIGARNTCVQFVRGRELTVAESLRLSFESVGVRRETAIE